MKKGFLGFLCLIFSFSLFAQNKEAKKRERLKPYPTILFETDTFDFGNIREGDIVVYEFKFRNGGKKPLILSDVNASCGCTIPGLTKKVVLPGDSGSIKVSFDSAHRPGQFSKFVTVNSNAKNTPATFVVIMGNVQLPASNPVPEKH